MPIKKIIALFALTAVLSTAAIGCSSRSSSPVSGTQAPSESAEPQSTSTASSSTGNQTGAAEEGAMRSYTDYKNHKVEIPVNPQRIVFAGETVGDLLELGVTPVGIERSTADRSLYADKVSKVEDIGFPTNLEKTASLNPDLMLIALTDEEPFAQLSKVGPAIMFNTFATLEERMTELGDLLNKKQEAADWLADYHSKMETMWAELLKSELKPGETASVFTYYPGDRLYVMAIAGLPQLLYSENGFKPTKAIQDVLDAGEGFRQISVEALPDFAGDRIFILNPVAEEAQQSTSKLMESQVWKGLPAVQAGHVYSLDIEKSNSDAFTRKAMLEELPKLLTGDKK